MVTDLAGPAPHDLHPLDVRVANIESKSRIRAAVSEFVDRHPDVHYFHSYEMVVTAERQSDYFRDDGRHIERHAVGTSSSEFLRLFADPALQLARRRQLVADPDGQDRATPAPRVRAPAPKPSLPRRVARRVRRSANAVLGRSPAKARAQGDADGASPASRSTNAA